MVCFKLLLAIDDLEQFIYLDMLNVVGRQNLREIAGPICKGKGVGF